MKRFILFSFLIFGLITSSLAQSSIKKQNLPKENSKVTREYDEKGNLIKFDSVYSYSYSSDSTFAKDFSPKYFSDFFGRDFNFKNDSSANGHSFFDNFDKMFAQPFGHFDAKHDSLFLKYFGGEKQFRQFGDNDSIAFGFNDFNDIFGNFFENQQDSTSAKNQDKFAGRSQAQSINEMMQRLRQQLMEMEKQQKQFFEQKQK